MCAAKKGGRDFRQSQGCPAEAAWLMDEYMNLETACERALARGIAQDDLGHAMGKQVPTANASDRDLWIAFEGVRRSKPPSRIARELLKLRCCLRPSGCISPIVSTC